MLQVVISLLLLIGLYFPTSINYNISSTLLMLNSLVLISLLILFILRKSNVKKTGLIIALGINLLLWFSTLITPFTEYRFGTAAYYLSLSVVFCLDLTSVKIGKYLDRLFLLVNVINLTLGYAIISQNHRIVEFIIKNYSAYYEELVPNMLMQQKPVLTFATHSVAGFFLYLFFFLCFSNYRDSNKITYLIFTLSYMVFLFYLNSVTAYIFLIVALVQLFWFFMKEKIKIFYIVTFSLIISCLFFIDKILLLTNEISYKMSMVFNSSDNGIKGRYSSSGNLQGNFEYLSENLFRPVGFGYTKEIMYADSGFIEYLTRGSFLLVLLIYIGFFIFLKRNLASKKTAYILFLMFMLFELGFSGLTYFRVIYFLPFMVVYLNSTRIKKVKAKQRVKAKRKVKIVWDSNKFKTPSNFL